MSHEWRAIERMTTCADAGFRLVVGTHHNTTPPAGAHNEQRTRLVRRILGSGALIVGTHLFTIYFRLSKLKLAVPVTRHLEDKIMPKIPAFPKSYSVPYMCVRHSTRRRRTGWTDGMTDRRTE